MIYLWDDVSTAPANTPPLPKKWRQFWTAPKMYLFLYLFCSDFMVKFFHFGFGCIIFCCLWNIGSTISRCNGHTIPFLQDYCCVYGFLTVIGKESNNFMSAKLNIEYLFPLFSLDCHDCSEFQLLFRLPRERIIVCWSFTVRDHRVLASC